MKICKMKRALSRLSILAAMFVLLVPALVFAQDVPAPAPAPAPATTAIQDAMAQVMSILIPVFVAFIGGLATWILRKVQQKLHIDIGEKTSAAWADLARRAALRGGEWARKKSKDLTEGKKIPGGEVMDVAAKWAIQMAEQQKLPVMAREKLEGLIEVELFKLRLEAAPTPTSTPPAV